MKRISIIIFTVLALYPGLNAQNSDDALRYSQLFYSGTARFLSMGGAFTALGGDISVLSQNPAGLGIFRTSEISVTPQLFHINTTSDFDRSTSDYLYDFNLTQAGVVANILNRNADKGILTLNVGYSYNKTNNLNQNIMIDGISDFSSLADYWVDKAEGYYHDELSGIDDPSTFLAYDTWLIDTLSGFNTLYGSVYSNYGDDPPSVYGQNIRRLVTYEGFTGEHALSVGGNYSNKLFFGATLGISRLSYSSKYEHLETTDADLPSNFTDFNYTFYYKNTGFGYTVKLGAIFKPIEPLRVGVAFHSPTFYRIDEYVEDNLTSSFSDGGNYESSNEPTRYNYALTTPFRVMIGAAYQLKKLALFSADYEFTDYSSARFSETGDGFDYSEKNLAIRNSLKAVNNFRLGAELRFNSLYLRGGYGYYGKAYKAGDINEDLDYSIFSLGGGFREQNIIVDFGYSRLMNSQDYILYSSSIETLGTNLNINRNMFTLTFGYKFGF
ncbi:MAG: outer membrane protein transport protein [Bacteroidales bacterium]|nr:outer membrane protein transport protein [Bacteroidales bacterium]